jgi:Organic Anion Transporter Polypeptide (OATP) family
MRGLASPCIFTFSAFPAPILYGRVIDSVCVVQQQMTCSRKGACLLYDHDSFRWKLHIMAVFAKVGASICYLVAFFVNRQRSAAAENGAIAADKELKSIEPNDKKVVQSTTGL